MSILEVKNCTKKFGGLVAVRNLNISLNQGDLYGLIGPNGAGKTTVFNLLTGVYAPDEGSIELNGQAIHRQKPSSIAKLGVSRTFQNIRLFQSMTVIENVKLARHLRKKQGLFDAIIRTSHLKAEEDQIEQDALELLKIFNLDKRAYELARNLPYGSQRRLEIARALGTKPKVLLLDEPAAGMNPNESIELMHLIQWIRDKFEITVLLVEHNMRVVMGVCEKIQVIDYGETIAMGTPKEIQGNPKVIEAYLGGGLMLEIKNVSSSYGAIEALKSISIRIDKGEIVTLIGANGAGKSTTLRNIAGLVASSSGEILFEGQTLNGVPTHKITALGISMVPEGRAIFSNLTVFENLEMGAYLQTNTRENAKELERVFSLFPRLKERLKQLGGTLSGGEQQMLAIGRAMMARPRLLLLDEPSLGLAPMMVHTIFKAIDEINKEGTTILLVEQNASAALKHSHRAYVLETGAIVMEGPSQQVAGDPRVKEAYLGES